MLRTLLLTTMALGLSACLNNDLPSQPEDTPYVNDLPPLDTAPDSCGRTAVLPYIGQNFRDIPESLLGLRARVYETGSMLTMDYRFDRINVEYDPSTHLVIKVSCG